MNAPACCAQPLGWLLGRGWGGLAGISVLCLVAGEARGVDCPDALHTLAQGGGRGRGGGGGRGGRRGWPAVLSL